MPLTDVRNHRILEIGLVQENGLCGQRKKVDDRRASEAQSLGRHVQLEHLAALGALEVGDQKDDLDTRAEASLLQCLQSVEVEEKELLRKGEIFLQDAVTGKGLPRIGQKRFVVLKSHRPQTASGQGDRQFARVGREISDQNLGRVVAKQLVKGVDE